MKRFASNKAQRSPMTNSITPPPVPDVAGRTHWNDSAERHHVTRLAQVAQATASAVIVTDTQGVIVWVNEGFTRITGFSFSEALGRTPGQLLQGPETDLGEVARIRVALRSRQSVAAELVNYAKDGRRYWIGMKIEPLLDANGEFDGFMAIEADITIRHEERIAFEQLTRRFNAATQAARVGMFERDASFKIVWWNQMMWEILGQNPAIFKPTKESWLGLIHPQDREYIRERVAQMAQGNTAIDLLYRIIRPDGEVRHIRAIGAPAQIQDGIGNHVTGITLDVTERIEAQERERALQAQLRASSHLAGMAEIATGILHNVGNVLNSLGIANTTARRDLKALRLERLEQATTLLLSNRDSLGMFLTEDERGRHLPDFLSALSAQIVVNARAIEAELEAAEKLLQHLSDIVSAQQELARVGGQRESLGLRDLVESALLVQASELGQIELVREYDEVPDIMSDRHKLLQILVNLISNARDAVQEAAPERPRILVKLSRDGNHVLVTIEDSGIGISEEVLSQVWQFGFTTKKKGHGFGLHNSANAAQEIGGTLTAHSDGVGHGARFILRLPIDNSKPMLSGVAA